MTQQSKWMQLRAELPPTEQHEFSFMPDDGGMRLTCSCGWKGERWDVSEFALRNSRSPASQIAQAAMERHIRDRLQAFSSDPPP